MKTHIISFNPSQEVQLWRKANIASLSIAVISCIAILIFMHFFEINALNGSLLSCGAIIVTLSPQCLVSFRINHKKKVKKESMDTSDYEPIVTPDSRTYSNGASMLTSLVEGHQKPLFKIWILHYSSQMDAQDGKFRFEYSVLDRQVQIGHLILADFPRARTLPKTFGQVFEIAISYKGKGFRIPATEKNHQKYLENLLAQIGWSPDDQEKPEIDLIHRRI